MCTWMDPLSVTTQTTGEQLQPVELVTGEATKFFNHLLGSCYIYSIYKFFCPFHMSSFFIIQHIRPFVGVL